MTVAEKQLSLAIGKDGQNARLAARLTGWRVDVIKPGEQPREEAVEKVAPEKDLLEEREPRNVPLGGLDLSGLDLDAFND